MSALVTASSPWEWISSVWAWVLPRLQAFEALGVIVAAVLALLALVLEARRRRLDQFLQLTDVAAWAEPVGIKSPVEEGLTVSVRNGTGQALQQTQAWIWPRYAVPPHPAQVSVPLIPPHDTRTFTAPPTAFAWWDARMRHRDFLVAVKFQDARGRWWWRLPNGRMLRRDPVKIAQEPPLPYRRGWRGWRLRWLSLRTRAIGRLKQAATWRPK